MVQTLSDAQPMNMILSRDFYLSVPPAGLPNSSFGLAQLSDNSFIEACNFMHKINGGSRNLQAKTLKLYKYIIGAFGSIDFESISVRGLYYRVISLYSDMPKTEKSYEMIQRAAYDMRRKGILDFDLIIDGTRFRSKQTSYSGLEAFAEEQSKFYRKSLWEESEFYVEIAVEKDAMKSILYRTTNYYDINLISTKGFSSLTFWYTTAETFRDIIDEGKTPVLLMMTDFDEAGRNMRKSAADILSDVFGLEEGDDYILYELAVTEQQIKDYNLPLRPEKNKHSPVDYAVEIDAFKPSDIRDILEDAILEYIDVYHLEQIRKIEKLERDSIPELLRKGIGK